MSAPTLQMPSSFDDGLRSVCSDAVNQAVGLLAVKYGFSVEQAMRDLNLDEMKFVRKRGPSPKTEKSVDKKDKTKKTKKVKDPDAPKRPKTGYLLFQDAKRAEVRSELEAKLEPGVKLASKDVVKAIAELWSALGKEEKAGWKPVAAEPSVADPCGAPATTEAGEGSECSTDIDDY